MRISTLIAASATIVTTVKTVSALEPSSYQRPPDAIARILEAAPSPTVSLDPTRTHMVLLKREALPPISDLAAPMLRLAGGRYNPNTNGPHGPRAYIGMTLRSVADSKDERALTLPDASIGSPNWSLDGSKFAFTITFPDRIELWLCDFATASAKKLIDRRLNSASGAAVRWMPDGKTLLVRLVPANRPPMPVEPAVPAGPVVQETAGAKAQVATYQDLLKNSYDESLFDWIMQTQLALVDVASGKVSEIGQPGIYSGIDPSPDGRFLLTSRIEHPYSYTVPESQFPEVYEVLDASGKLVRELHKTGNREQIPIQGVEVGPRAYEWIDTADSTLLYAEALDGGDPKNKAPHRDRVFTLTAPFNGEGKELLKTEHRFTGINFLQPDGTRSRLALVSEYDRDRKWSRTWLINIDSNQKEEPRLFRDLSVNDRYSNPGNPLTTRLPNGRSVIRVENGTLYLAGAGATPQGNRPFLDQKSLADFSTRHIWRSDGTGYESVIDVLSDNTTFLTSFESATDVPNYFVRTFDQAGTVTDRKAVTAFTDPVPELRKVKKQLVNYKRADGTDLSATLYLPPDYQPGTKLPLFIWAYPLEYTDKSTAGQVSAAPNTFVRMGGISHLCLVMAGYAVMDEATMPIVGDPETVNDKFVEQIVSSAQAAIDKAVEMGVADRDRVAVGGHSYGAFMTANLLAHCDLFRAGIARSGAYNRTLTPFGFQGERRTYWEATDTYTKMSPFTFADKIKTPLLMIHGQLDNNPGTFPIQSDRLFAAIKGLGGTARLVTLPYESHGYSAKESAMHVQAEMVKWLDTYVKNAKPRASASEAEKVADASKDAPLSDEVNIGGRPAKLAIYAWRNMMPGPANPKDGLLLSASLRAADKQPLPAGTDLTDIVITQGSTNFNGKLVKEREGADLERMLRSGPDLKPNSRCDVKVKVVLPDGKAVWLQLKDQEIHRAD